MTYPTGTENVLYAYEYIVAYICTYKKKGLDEWYEIR
jgi:hypothetical protein